MPAAANQPILLTGCGWVTSRAAGTIDEVLAALQPTGAAVTAAPDDQILPEELSKDRGGRLAGLALVHARRSAAWQDGLFAPERVGFVLGCALAGQAGMIGFANEVRQQTPRFVSPLHFPQTVGNYVAGALARGFGLRGPNLTLASGGASGLDALAEAFELLVAGRADAVFAGGVTECPPGWPDSTAVSDGACLFMLERGESAVARGVKPLATMIGYTRSPAAAQAQLRRCPGTTGVAAVAAAVGAAWGQPVPVLAAEEAEGVSVRSSAAPDGATRVIVQAASDAGHATGVELGIPAIRPGETR